VAVRDLREGFDYGEPLGAGRRVESWISRHEADNLARGSKQVTKRQRHRELNCIVGAEGIRVDDAARCGDVTRFQGHHKVVVDQVKGERCFNARCCSGETVPSRRRRLRAEANSARVMSAMRMFTLGALTSSVTV
jgi:hypothetical protein